MVYDAYTCALLSLSLILDPRALNFPRFSFVSRIFRLQVRPNYLVECLHFLSFFYSPCDEKKEENGERFIALDFEKKKKGIVIVIAVLPVSG